LSDFAFIYMKGCVKMTAHINDFQGKRVHFIGIGGSSMSGLSTLMQKLGYQVTGSDRDRSHKTDALKSAGIPVVIGHRPETVRGADFIVFSAAIAPENPERAEAFRLGIPQIERSDLIGQLMEGCKTAIGISGTHGKTTTTAMLAQVMVESGVRPTVHIGGELDALGGSTLLGDKDYFVVEACEFNASFLKFLPTIAVILNIDEDHLDFYRDIDDIERAFLAYARRTPEDGFCVGCGDDARVRRVMAAAGRKSLSYGLGPSNQLRATGITYDPQGKARFTATFEGQPLCRVEMSVPGEHNLLNALCIIAVARLCGLAMDVVASTLSRFSGAHRRFELTSVTDGVHIYHDYGHNPTEIKNALHIARMQPHKRLWAVWQPHTYSRTKKLFGGFVEAFDEADHALITDICAARESDPGDIRSEMLIEPIRARGVDAALTPTFDDAEAHLRAHWQPGDLVITLGCGNIDLLNEQIALHSDTPAGAPSGA
jgi:UDP-N-acetylmuramate--alanine ligase